MKKSYTLSMLFFLLFALSIGFHFDSVQVQADRTEEIKEYVTYYNKKSNKDSKQNTFIIGKNSNLQSITVTSSNKKIATAKTDNYYGNISYTVTAKKPGTAIITVTRTYTDGTTSNDQTKYVVNKYTSPVKTFKIGKTDLTSKYKYSRWNSGKKLNGKLVLKLKKGWKVSEAYKFDYTTLGSDGFTKVPVKLNKKITLPKKTRLVLNLEKGNKKMTISYSTPE